MAKKTAKKKAPKKMTKAQIMAHLAEVTELSKKEVVGVVEALVALAYKEAKKGFMIPGLGKLVLVKRKARMGRNPQTGEAIKISARTGVKFRIAKACKVAVGGVVPKKKKKKAKKSKK